MNCREFEHKLWEKPGDYRLKDYLPDEMLNHLNSCQDCQKAYESFQVLFNIADRFELDKPSEYWQKFEAGVWNKIETAGADAKASKVVDNLGLRSRPKIGFAQFAASMGVAAVMVIFMVLAISNITDHNNIPMSMEKADKKGPAPKPMMHSKAPSVTSQVRTYDVVLNRAQDGGLEIKEFSLLPEPQVNIVDTSALVSIDEAYLTDEGLGDKDVTMNKALSKEIVMGKGVADTSIPEVKAEIESPPTSDYIITVEKMPRMIKAVPPSYPALAFRLKKGGEVWIKARINAQGNVENAIVYKDSGTDYGFEEAALSAAYKNEFEPFEVNGKNIPVWVIYKVRFVTKE